MTAVFFEANEYNIHYTKYVITLETTKIKFFLVFNAKQAPPPFKNKGVIFLTQSGSVGEDCKSALPVCIDKTVSCLPDFSGQMINKGSFYFM